MAIMVLGMGLKGETMAYILGSVEGMDYHKIPKVELHSHIEGIINLDILRKMKEQGYNLPVSIEKLMAFYPVITFDKFINWFQTLRPFFNNSELLLPVLASHIDSLRSQCVSYAEIMFSDRILQNETDMFNIFQKFRDLTNKLEDNQIEIEFLIAIERDQQFDKIASTSKKILMLHDAGFISGVALAGQEKGHRVKPLKTIFEQFHDNGLGIEIHAGEFCNSESVWDALENGFLNRIGHGISIFQDPQLIEEVKEREIHIEMCPTSNVNLGNVKSIEEHPIKQALDLEMNFSINTDDPGLFGCTMESEFKLIGETFDFNEQDFAKIKRNSLKSGFRKYKKRL